MFVCSIAATLHCCGAEPEAVSPRPLDASPKTAEGNTYVFYVVHFCELSAELPQIDAEFQRPVSHSAKENEKRNGEMNVSCEMIE